MLTLGEELLLIALDAEKGVVRKSAIIQIGLNAAGLAELVSAGWLQVRQADGSPGVIVAREDDVRGSEQPLLDQVLFQARQTQQGDRHPERCLKNWVSPSLFAYIKSLREREILAWDRPPRGALYGRLHLLDADAAASARARVERVATCAGPSERDVDLAAIVHGIGLDKVFYKGRRNRSKGETLTTALAKQRFSVMLGRVVSERPRQRFTFDSSNDLKMAAEMVSAWDRTP